ncbi:MAG: hypothetical protein A2Y62_08155, partial [Candidatus Fischerbacteria bacterium RBG_13_37_8]
NQVHKYACDISATLHKSARIFEQRIEDQWILFAPDVAGLPVVVNDWIHEVLGSFQNGARVSDIIIAYQARKDFLFGFDVIFSAIGFLRERGFLHKEPSTIPYSISTMQEPEPTSFGVWLHINNSCNLDCSYCFVKKDSGTVMSPEVMERTVLALVKTAKRHGIKQVYLKFAGGEPTLVISHMEQFRKLLQQHLHKSNVELHSSILSNGTIMNKRLLAFLKQPDTGFGISLDGYDDSHDIYRTFKNSRRGSWSAIIKNIGILKEHSITPHIMATISKETCSSLPELVQWIYENGFQTRLSIVRETNCSWECSTKRESEYQNLCDTMKEAFDKAFCALEHPSVSIDLRIALDICELQFDQPARGVACGIGRRHLVIKPDGNLVSCPMTLDEEGLAPSEDFDLLRTCREYFPYSPLERKYDTIENDCLSCRWFPVCAGGCPVVNKRVHGHPFTKSPMCDFYTYIIPRYIQFFATKLMQSAKQNKNWPLSIISKR